MPCSDNSTDDIVNRTTNDPLSRSIAGKGYLCYFDQGGDCTGPTSNTQGGITASMAGGSWLASLFSGFISDAFGRAAEIGTGRDEPARFVYAGEGGSAIERSAAAVPRFETDPSRAGRGGTRAAADVRQHPPCRQSVTYPPRQSGTQEGSGWPCGRSGRSRERVASSSDFVP